MFWGKPDTRGCHSQNFVSEENLHQIKNKKWCKSRIIVEIMIMHDISPETKMKVLYNQEHSACTTVKN